MMKKTLFILCAFLLTAVGASAQTSVHSCVAEFSDWSISGNSSGSFQLNNWSSEADASGMVVPFIEYWVGSGGVLPDATISHTQLTGLATGYYEVSIFARAFNENSTTSVSKGITFTANDASVDLTEGTAGEFGGVSEEDYGVYELLVYVSDGTLNIGFTVSGLTACDWMAFKNLEVTYLGTSPVGYVAHECEAYGDDWGKPAHWTADNDATTNLHVNKHSTEADPSGMVTPFVEYWYAAGNNLPDDVLRHDQLSGLYPGYYNVSIDVRAFNESGTTAINEGVTTFNAVSGEKSASADITALISSTSFSSHYELYGTLYLIATVGDAGTLDIDFTVEDANYNWLSFKNLKVEYIGDEMPTLTSVTGTMNAAVETAMQAAVDAYNTTKNSTNYTVAMVEIEEAETSVAYYAPIVAAVAALDEAGAAVWETSEYATALANRTLTDEDVSADLAAAQKAQTTNGSDMTYVVKNTGEWTHDTASGVGNFQICPSLTTAHEAWTGSTFGGSIDDPSLPLYKEIADLPAGEYTISFYAYARYTGTDGAVALAFANDAEEQQIPTDNELVWSDATLYTFSCTVSSDGVLDFGLKSQGVGDWFVAEECSLTLDALAELQDTESDYKKGDTATLYGHSFNVLSNNMVENHSFELGFTGWTGANDFNTEITASNFELRSDDAQNGDVYLVGTQNGGASAASSLGTAWAIEAGKTYYYSYYIKALKPATSTNGSYMIVSLAEETPGKEDYVIINGTNPVSEDWQKVETMFTNTDYKYLQIDFRWLDSQWAFDNFQIYEVEIADELDGNDNDYEIGGIYQGEDGVTYSIVSDNMFVNGGFNEGVYGWTAGNGYSNKAVITNFNYAEEGGYNEGAYVTLKSSAGAAAATTPTQAIAVEAGKTYLFVGYTSGTAPQERYSALFEMDYNEDGILAEKSHTEGSTSYSNTIIQLVWGDGDEELNGWTQTIGVFTVPAEGEEDTYSYVGMRMNWSTGSYDGFQLYEIEEVIEWTLGASYGTLILPFDYDLSSTGLTAYTGKISSDGTEMELTAVDENAIKAYKPYIIGGAETAQTTYYFSGTPGEKEGPITDATSGLVGVLEDTYAPANSYVLQKQDEEPAFYIVESGETILVAAYHCYLTSTSNAKSITFTFADDVATAIDAVEATEETSSETIYDLSGRRVAKAQKGVYIVNGKKKVIK